MNLLLLLALCGLRSSSAQHPSRLPTQQPNPQPTDHPTLGSITHSPTMLPTNFVAGYVVKTYFFDSGGCAANNGESIFHEIVESVHRCFITEDGYGATMDLVVASNASSYDRITLSYNDTDCTGPYDVSSSEPLNPGVCLKSSLYPGSIYSVGLVARNEEFPPSQVKGLSTTRFSSLQDCVQEELPTLRSTFSAGICMPAPDNNFQGASSILLQADSLANFNVIYAHSTNCTGIASVAMNYLFNCSSEGSAPVGSIDAYVSSSFTGRPSVPLANGFQSTYRYSNITGELWSQASSRFSDSCLLTYSQNSSKPAPVGSFKSLAGKIVNDDYYIVTQSFPSLFCNGSYNISVDASQPIKMQSSLYTMTDFVSKVSISLPPLAILGYLTTKYDGTDTCSDQADVYYQEVFRTDFCMPAPFDYFYYEGIGSFIYVNNYDYVGVKYFESSNCVGTPRFKTELDIYPCVTSSNVPHYSISKVFTSSTSTNILQLLFNLNVAWNLRIVVASLAALAGLLMIALLCDLKRWTELNRIICIPAVLQLFVDATFLADTNRRTGRQEYYGRAGEADENIRRYYYGSFFRFFFTIASCYTSNVLMLTVLYVVTFGRSLKLRHHFRTTFFAIFVISALPSLMFFLHEFDLYEVIDKGKTGLFKMDMEESTRDEMFSQTLEAVRIVIIGSISLNILGMALAFVAIRKMTTNKNRTLDVATELFKRVGIYPIVQTLTQCPALWYDLAYFAPLFDKSKTTSDDTYYKTPSYSACWILMSILTPSGGIWFTALLLYFNADIRKRLVSRLGWLRDRSRTMSEGSDRSSSQISSSKVKVYISAFTSKKSGTTDRSYGKEEEEVRDEIPQSLQEGELLLRDFDEDELTEVVDRLAEILDDDRENAAGASVKDEGAEGAAGLNRPLSTSFSFKDDNIFGGREDAVGSGIAINPLTALSKQDARLAL